SVGTRWAAASAMACLGGLPAAPPAAGRDPGRPPAGLSTSPAGWRAEVARIEAGLRAGLATAAGAEGVADVRVLGAIGVVQLDRDVDVAAATAAAVRAGGWLRPFRDLIYTMPPYVTSDDDVAATCAAVVAAASAGPTR